MHLLETNFWSLFERVIFGVADPKFSHLFPFTDNKVLIRVKTKVSNREVINDFCSPVILSSSTYAIVFRLIMDILKEIWHVIQMIMANLRQHFWILGGWKTLKKIINLCVKGKRHISRKVDSIPIPLPLDRVQDSRAFEVTNIDLSGPLNLKSEKGTSKAWVYLFTCIVYRFFLVHSLPVFWNLFFFSHNFFIRVFFILVGHLCISPTFLSLF